MSWDTKHGDKVLQVAASSWAIHLYEILMPLMIVPSGTLVLLPPGDNLNMTRFCKTIKDKQITILFINPSLLKILLDYFELDNRKHNETLERVRILWTSGESPEVQHLTKIKSFSSQTRIFLIFSMTETSAAIGREITESIDELTDLSIVPIGYPLGDYQCLLVDENNNGRVISPLDTNKIGQIYLAGIISYILETMQFCYLHIYRCWSFSVLLQQSRVDQ
jgi:acyl-coenzyme A synthetase/AMP-(fatty) acid ligase